MQKLTVRRLVICSALAASYAALTIMTADFAYGPIQFRIAEALCVLPFFMPFTSIGLFIGCLIANIFSTVSALDMVVGSAATLIACLWTSRLKTKQLAIMPAIIVNTVMVGAMLAYVFTPDAFFHGLVTMALEVCAGEAAVMLIIGLPFVRYLDKSGICKKLDR